MQGVVAFVLLIACGNVAGLLLARSSARKAELAVRAAIGADRARIAQQLLTESVLLTLAGGVGALAVAWVLLRVLATAGSSLVQGLPPVAIDGRTLAFTLTIALVTGLVFGSAPSIRGARQGVAGAGALTASTRGATDGASRQRLRAALVVGQIGLASVLLVGSGLLIGSFIRLRDNDLGGDPKQVIRFTVPFSGDHYLHQNGFYKGTPLVDVSSSVVQNVDRILDRARMLPGVQAVSGSSVAPFASAGPLIEFDIEGRPAPPDGAKQALAAAFQLVTPGFFETMRMPMARGRAFANTDTATGPWTMVVNEAMAKQFWPSGDAIGQRVVLDLSPEEQPREIVGIVRNVRATPYDQEIRPAMYVLYNQQAPHTRGPLGTIMRSQMSFLLRVPGPPAPVIADFRAAMRSLAPDLPIADARPVEADVAGVLEPSQYSMQLLAICAGVAMLLAAVGIYGVTSFGVGQRTREIGVRMALGATRGQVLHLIMRQVVFFVAAGLAIGFTGAMLLTRVMSSVVSALLFGIQPTDLPTYAIVGLVMAGVALLAGWLPARRAMRVAPTTALHCE
jgi:putative ABC transport system permease protein